MLEQKERSSAKHKRTPLDEMELSIGKKARLRRLLYDHGARNGTALLLPLDQGLEHGPRDFAPNPASIDPTYVLTLAKEGDFNGVALGIGLAKRYMRPFAGQVPLIVKLNGKTEIPPDDEPISPYSATVEEAVALGADAVGYTMYVGSSLQDQDFRQFMEIRNDAERLGMPTIVWAYPRGKYVEAKGGRDSLYAIDYAARVASEMGADVIKLNLPVVNPEKDKLAPKPYSELKLSEDEAMAKVVVSAGKSLVLLSGGSMIDDDGLIKKARAGMEAGVTGFIFGRNIWQRPLDKAVVIATRLKDMLKQY